MVWSSTSTSRGSYTTSEYPKCIQIGISASGTIGSTIYFDADTCKGSITLPPPPPPPPEVVTCKFLSDIYINHGIITSDQVHGHTAKNSADLYCSGEALVKVSIKGDNGSVVYLSKDKKLTTTLQVDGHPEDKGVLLDFSNKGSREVIIYSVLNGEEPTIGQFSGNAIMIIEMQ